MDDLRKSLIRLAHANPDLQKDLLPLLKVGSGAGRETAGSKAYKEKLKKGVSEEDAAHHRSFLRKADEICRLLEEYLFTGKTFEDVFSPEDIQQIISTTKMIRGYMLPMPLLKVKKEEPIFLPPGSY